MKGFRRGKGFVSGDYCSKLSLLLVDEVIAHYGYTTDGLAVLRGVQDRYKKAFITTGGRNNWRKQCALATTAYEQRMDAHGEGWTF